MLTVFTTPPIQNPLTIVFDARFVAERRGGDERRATLSPLSSSAPQLPTKPSADGDIISASFGERPARAAGLLGAII